MESSNCGKGVKGCNCILCETERTGGGDSIVAGIGVTLLLIVIFIAICYIAWSCSS